MLYLILYLIWCTSSEKKKIVMPASREKVKKFGNPQSKSPKGGNGINPIRSKKPWPGLVKEKEERRTEDQM